MKKSGEHVRINFGQTPFVFDIDGMMAVRICVHLENLPQNQRYLADCKKQPADFDLGGKKADPA
jgi:hypothetical protein